MFSRERDSEARASGERDSKLTYENEQRKNKFRKIQGAQNSCEWHL